VIVVGGGVGGMAVAGRLARARPGWEIVVLEKNAQGTLLLFGVSISACIGYLVYEMCELCVGM